MKIGKQYLQLLTKEQQEKFMVNLHNCTTNNTVEVANYLEDEFNSFEEFITEAFYWSATDEGFDY